MTILFEHDIGTAKHKLNFENISIIIPIFEETSALEFSKFYFDKLNLKPTYALDSKRIERRKSLEEILGQSVSVYDNPGNCIEANYETLANLSTTDWILRIDCDEVPNLQLLEHCAKFIARPTDAYCGFDRDDVLWRGSHFERLKYNPFFFDSQYRLFNRRQVKFVKKIHTPGFEMPKWKLPLIPLWHGPLSARIYHLQRNFTSAQQRAEKVARYNSSGQSKTLGEWIRKDDESFKWTKLNAPELNSIYSQWLEKQL